MAYTTTSISRIILHVVGWILLYLLPYMFSFEGLPNIFTMFSHPGDYVHLVSFLALIAFSYLNYNVLVPEFYLKHRYFVYLIVVVVCLCIVVMVPMELLHFPHSKGSLPPMHGLPPGGGEGKSKPLLFGRNYTILVFVISVFIAVAANTRKHLERIERERLSAELSFLKAQINPHFLFNTLNSIYSLAINKDDRTGDAIVQLSELMRYTIKEANETVVDLEKEINYIRNYISLQQARLGETVVINSRIEGDCRRKKIAPLLLITFIENAFKHGVNPDEPSAVTITISIEAKELKLYVKNNHIRSINDDAGIGLKNVTDRLQLQYAGKHELTISDNEQHYIVELSIEL